MNRQTDKAETSADKCTLGGASIRDLMIRGYAHPGAATPNVGMGICPKCGRELRISKAGFHGGRGRLPVHRVSSSKEPK
jgi:hypothetical protein